MNSVERVLRRRGDLLLGLWSVRSTLVLMLIGIASIEVAGTAAGGMLGAAQSLCIVALFATIGFSAARPSTGATWREAMSRRLRFGLPPYILVILLSVAVLGPALTSRDLRDYGTDPETYAYLLNLVGVPRFELPGVFEFNNATYTVNAIVWAAPFYLLVVAIAALRSARRVIRALPAALLAAVALGSLLAEALDLLPGSSRDLAVIALRGDGTAALLGGLGGAAAFQARRWLPINLRLAVASLALVAIGIRLSDSAGQAAPLFRVGVALPAIYLAVFGSLRPLPLTPIGRTLAPILPGLLLFSYPLQQIASELAPRSQGPVLNLAIAAPAAALLAMGLWLLIGRRIVGRPLAPKTVQVTPLRTLRRFLRTARQLQSQAVIGYLAAATLIAGIFLALLWMVYLAMQPDAGGL